MVEGLGVQLRRIDLEVDAARVAVFEVGAGEPCVLLHGYPQSHACWRKIVPALAAGRRVIAPDWFGWGASERSFAQRPCFDDEVERLGLLLDRLGIDRANLFGHDYGGLIGLAFAAASPERVLRLALINTRAHRRPALGSYLGFSVGTWMARTPGLRWLLTRWAHWIHLRVLGRYVRGGAFSQRELLGYLRWMQEPEGRRWFGHFWKHFRAGAHPELGAAAERFRMPVALIWGVRDSMFPFSIARDLARRIPHAALVALDGDHYILEEKPEEVTAALLTLLEAAAPD